MKKFIVILAVACTAPTLATANQGGPVSPHSFTANVAIVSQYVFRGLTQTDGRPAIQGGFDYAHASGFYAGLWGSNVSWITDGYASGASYSVELDTYAGWKFALPLDITLDVGFLRYNYPGHAPAGGFAAGTARPDTNEIYAAAGWKWVTLKYSYSLGDTFGVQDARGSDYIDLSAAVPLSDTGFTLSGHVGHQRYRGTNAALWPAASGCTNSCLSYTDYRIGVNKEWLGITFGLGFTTTDARATAPDGTAIYANRFGTNIGRNQWIVSAQKTF
ncbi:MAG TPA: TorF family putative porin [Castellaniella sp.]|nr:TorF family putative porin [Castellaniella sp.]